VRVFDSSYLYARRGERRGRRDAREGKKKSCLPYADLHRPGFFCYFFMFSSIYLSCRWVKAYQAFRDSEAKALKDVSDEMWCI
jgi:hypothetical protein